jgi:drug/metabolite transporter (DMT)-like permease
VSWKVWSAFAALALIWGIPYLLIKLAVAEISPAGVAWARIALGAAFLLPIAARRGTLGAALAHWKAVGAFAVAELVLPFSLIALGERWISSSLTAILIATLPFMVILLAPAFGVHEVLGRRRLFGLLCGFAGVITLLGFTPLHGTSAWLGVLCVLTGTGGYAVGSLIVQRWLGGVDELGAVALSLAIGTVLLLPAAVHAVPAHVPSAAALLSVTVLGIVCTAVALWLYFYLVGQAGVARATLITYFNPLVASAAGVIVLAESFAVSMGLGMVLILLGTWMATRTSGGAGVAAS